MIAPECTTEHRQVSLVTMIPLSTLRGRARELGFCDAGAARALPGPEGEALAGFVAAGYHAGMSWMARDQHRRSDPGQLLAGARSVVIAAAELPPSTAPSAGDGCLALYARLPDYHDVLLPPLMQLAELLQDPDARVYVDTGPIMEKVWAARAGLGWIGLQTHLISRRHGGRLLLGSIVTRAEVEPAAPQRDLCGRCTRCVDACPTGALAVPAAGQPQLDARRCRSYLTIEHRGSFAEELRPTIGDALFGCDLCVDACPWNRFAGNRAFPGLDYRLPARLDPAELLALDGPGFQRRFRGTPVTRARRRGLLRNAAVVMGNLASGRFRAPLRRCLEEEADPIIREHAEWAIQRV